MQKNANVVRLKQSNTMSTLLRSTLELPNKRPQSDKIVVMGGTGCVGKFICKHATKRSYNVWSLSKNFPYSFPNYTTGMYDPTEEEDEPWPLLVTWKRFDILRPFARARLMADLNDAKTMIHCVGQQRLDFGFSKYEIDKNNEPYAIRALTRIQRRRELHSPEQEFEDTNYRSVICAFDIAKQSNIRNFIYISASGTFPTWMFRFGDMFIHWKRKAEAVLAGEHYCKDGTPMNIVILRPSFIHTDRKPFTSGFEFLQFPSSPVASNLTADRVARCALDLAVNFTPQTTKLWDLSVRSILEDEDILRFINESDGVN